MPSGVYSKTEEHKKKISDGCKRNGVGKWMKGTKFSDEHKRKISLSRMGEKSWTKRPEVRAKMSQSHRGKKLSIEHRQKLSEIHLALTNKILKDTSIELKVETELKRRNVNYQKQVPLCKIAIVDFYLPEYRIIIQCDGDYWHNLPKQKEKDMRQDRILTFNGFNIYRFWEHEINESVEKCIDKIRLLLDEKMEDENT